MRLPEPMAVDVIDESRPKSLSRTGGGDRPHAGY